MGRRRGSRSAFAAAVVLSSLLTLGLPTGLARAEPVVKGKTRLVLARTLATALRRGGVQVSKLKQATLQGRTISLPVASGEVDVASGAGSIELEGGFRLARGARSVALTALRLDTAKRTLWGKVDGRGTKIASFAAYTVERVGFGDQVAVAALLLQPDVAAQLGRELGKPRLFRPAAPFASVSSSFKPQFDTLAKGTLQLSLDPGTLAKLKAAEVVPQPFEALTVASEPPTYAASLIGGIVYPDLRGGSAGVEAGIRLQRETPRTVVSWLGLSVSLESNKVFADSSLGSPAGSSPRGVGPIAALDLSGATARVDPGKRTVTITGARATLEASAAALLNEAFAKGAAQPLVAAGDPLGEISLWMTGH
ncbi:MAG: hypothetical protein ABW065_14195 [Solirubrobacterales bacterium]